MQGSMDIVTYAGSLKSMAARTSTITQWYGNLCL